MLFGLVQGISNGIILQWGKISTQTNNSTVVNTLTTSYSSINYVCVTNCIEERHWSHVITQTISTFTTYVTDISVNRDSGFNYICIGY